MYVLSSYILGANSVDVGLDFIALTARQRDQLLVLGGAPTRQRKGEEEGSVGGGNRLGSVRGFVGCVGGERSCAWHLFANWLARWILGVNLPRGWRWRERQKKVIVMLYTVPCVREQESDLFNCNVGLQSSCWVHTYKMKIKINIYRSSSQIRLGCP